MLSKYFQRSTQGRAGRRGFTLLELLIVIALLAILAVVVILVLNPAETLRRARDSQRLSDLSTVKSALALYLTDSASPDLDGLGATGCQGTGTTRYGGWSGNGATGTSNITDTTADSGADATGTNLTMNTTRQDRGATGSAATVLATGSWVPVDLSGISGGSPLSNYPLEPSFTAVLATVDEDTDRLYVYGCRGLQYELNGVLESSSNDSKENADGGDNPKVHETGTVLDVVGCWDDTAPDATC